MNNLIHASGACRNKKKKRVDIWQNKNAESDKDYNE